VTGRASTLIVSIPRLKLSPVMPEKGRTNRRRIEHDRHRIVTGGFDAYGE